jgi:hypothetical protein
MPTRRLGELLTDILVAEQGFTVDLAPIREAMAIRAQGNEICGIVRLAFVPWDDVVKIYVGGAAALLNGTPMTCFHKYLAANFGRNGWSLSHWAYNGTS